MNVIEEKISKYQEYGLFLNPHNFDLPLKIRTIFENVLLNYPFAVIFEDDCIYEIPVNDPYSYEIYEGEAGYLSFLNDWAETLESAYEGYLDGEYFEDEEELAIYHEECSKELMDFISVLR